MRVLPELRTAVVKHARNLIWPPIAASKCRTCEAISLIGIEIVDSTFKRLLFALLRIGYIEIVRQISRVQPVSHPRFCVVVHVAVAIGVVRRRVQFRRLLIPEIGGSVWL